MSSAEIQLQKAVGARLAGFAALTALVPAAAILDRHARPAPDPSIILGEGQVVDDGALVRRGSSTVYLDLHVWKKETGTAGVKAIVAEIKAALDAGRLLLDAGWSCADCLVSSRRYLRDPDGVTSHAVVTLQATIEELA